MQNTAFYNVIDYQAVTKTGQTTARTAANGAISGRRLLPDRCSTLPRQTAISRSMRVPRHHPSGLVPRPSLQAVFPSRQDQRYEQQPHHSRNNRRGYNPAPEPVNDAGQKSRQPPAAIYHQAAQRALQHRENNRRKYQEPAQHERHRVPRNAQSGLTNHRHAPINHGRKR